MIESLIGDDILVDHGSKAVLLPDIPHDPFDLFFPHGSGAAVKFNTLVQSIPESSAVVIME